MLYDSLPDESPQSSKKSKCSSSALQKCKTNVLHDSPSDDPPQSSKKSKHSSSVSQNVKQKCCMIVHQMSQMCQMFVL